MRRKGKGRSICHGQSALVTCIAYILIGLLMLHGMIVGNEFYSSFGLTRLLYCVFLFHVLRQVLKIFGFPSNVVNPRHQCSYALQMNSSPRHLHDLETNYHNNSKTKMLMWMGM
ncbi:hypothetical protein F5Y03DRAFT_209637 [Xylaria venustula]|nr:hypothetical protein F5Y03DRAFT_209637 [Xylaria venustula]